MQGLIIIIKISGDSHHTDGHMNVIIPSEMGHTFHYLLKLMITPVPPTNRSAHPKSEAQPPLTPCNTA